MFCKNVVVPKETDEETTISIRLPAKYVPVELIHQIQSLLPEKDAARTCVLSNSWLRAWSTIPTLRFTNHLTKVKELQYVMSIDRILLRRLRENLSINSIQLHLDIDKLSLPSPVENWFQVLASGNCRLKELSLIICGTKLNKEEAGCLMIPDAIFSCENLNTISVIAADNIELYKVKMNVNPAIKCLCLRVLELANVCISEAELDNLFSSCSLLEQIKLRNCQQMKIIKVKNLRFLRDLRIRSLKHIDILEINDVPSLEILSFGSCIRPFTMSTDTLGSVRELYLARVRVDHTFSDMILSKFPFLETLYLVMPRCMLETFEITSDSLKEVTLNYTCSDMQMNIHIFAPKLLSFSYEGHKMPSLLFPSKTPAKIELVLRLHKSHPIDLSFFLKVREALYLSSNFDIKIKNNFVPLNVRDLDDLRRIFPFPARNVQLVSFGEHLDTKLWKHSPLFYFLFSICHPPYVKAYYRSSDGKNYWYEQMMKMMEQKTCDLNDIEIKNPGDGKWESLTNSWRNDDFLCKLPWRSFYDAGNDYNSDEFKLNWWRS